MGGGDRWQNNLGQRGGVVDTRGCGDKASFSRNIAVSFSSANYIISFLTRNLRLKKNTGTEKDYFAVGKYFSFHPPPRAFPPKPTPRDVARFW